MATKSPPAEPGGFITRPSLTLTRRLSARPEKVFAAWTDPQNIVQWFGPSSVKTGTTRAEVDPREGGRYHISFTTDTGEYQEVAGFYREVVPNQRLVFSWAWHSTPERESQVTVSLKPDGNGTLLILHQENFADQPARDAHQQGWTSTLDKLERYIA